MLKTCATSLTVAQTTLLLLLLLDASEAVIPTRLVLFAAAAAATPSSSLEPRGFHDLAVPSTSTDASAPSWSQWCIFDPAPGYAPSRDLWLSDALYTSVLTRTCNVTIPADVTGISMWVTQTDFAAPANTVSLSVGSELYATCGGEWRFEDGPGNTGGCKTLRRCFDGTVDAMGGTTVSITIASSVSNPQGRCDFMAAVRLQFNRFTSALLAPLRGWSVRRVRLPSGSQQSLSVRVRNLTNSVFLFRGANESACVGEGCTPRFSWGSNTAVDGPLRGILSNATMTPCDASMDLFGGLPTNCSAFHVCRRLSTPPASGLEAALQASAVNASDRFLHVRYSPPSWAGCPAGDSMMARGDLYFVGTPDVSISRSGVVGLLAAVNATANVVGLGDPIFVTPRTGALINASVQRGADVRSEALTLYSISGMAATVGTFACVVDRFLDQIMPHQCQLALPSSTNYLTVSVAQTLFDGAFYVSVAMGGMRVQCGGSYPFRGSRVGQLGACDTYFDCYVGRIPDGVSTVTVTYVNPPSVSPCPLSAVALLTPSTKDLSPLSCGSGLYACLIDRTCVPQRNVCNGINDCSDGSDEDLCRGYRPLGPYPVVACPVSQMATFVPLNNNNASAAASSVTLEECIAWTVTGFRAGYPSLGFVYGGSNCTAVYCVDLQQPRLNIDTSNATTLADSVLYLRVDSDESVQMCTASLNCNGRGSVLTSTPPCVCACTAAFTGVACEVARDMAHIGDIVLSVGTGGVPTDDFSSLVRAVGRVVPDVVVVSLSGVVRESAVSGTAVQGHRWVAQQTKGVSSDYFVSIAVTSADGSSAGPTRRALLSEPGQRAVTAALAGTQFQLVDMSAADQFVASAMFSCRFSNFTSPATCTASGLSQLPMYLTGFRMTVMGTALELPDRMQPGPGMSCARSSVGLNTSASSSVSCAPQSTCTAEYVVTLTPFTAAIIAPRVAATEIFPSQCTSSNGTIDTTVHVMYSTGVPNVTAESRTPSRIITVDNPNTSGALFGFIFTAVVGVVLLVILVIVGRRPGCIGRRTVLVLFLTLGICGFLVSIVTYTLDSTKTFSHELHIDEYYSAQCSQSNMTKVPLRVSKVPIDGLCHQLQSIGTAESPTYVKVVGAVCDVWPPVFQLITAATSAGCEAADVTKAIRVSGHDCIPESSVFLRKPSEELQRVELYCYSTLASTARFNTIQAAYAALAPVVQPLHVAELPATDSFAGGAVFVGAHRGSVASSIGSIDLQRTIDLNNGTVPLGNSVVVPLSFEGATPSQSGPWGLLFNGYNSSSGAVGGKDAARGSTRLHGLQSANVMDPATVKTKPWTLSFWLRANNASRGFVYAIADSWMERGTFASPIVDRATDMLESGLDGTGFFTGWQLYSGVYVNGHTSTLALVSGSGASGLVKLTWDSSQAALNVGRLFDDTWHSVTITVSYFSSRRFAQLFIDGQTSYVDSGWAQCYPTGYAPGAIATLPSVAQVTEASTQQVQQGGVMYLGYADVGLSDLRFLPGVLEQEAIIGLGAPPMRRYAFIDVVGSLVAGYLFLAEAVFFIGVTFALLIRHYLEERLRRQEEEAQEQQDTAQPAAVGADVKAASGNETDKQQQQKNTNAVVMPDVSFQGTTVRESNNDALLSPPTAGVAADGTPEGKEGKEEEEEPALARQKTEDAKVVGQKGITALATAGKRGVDELMMAINNAKAGTAAASTGLHAFSIVIPSFLSVFQAMLLYFTGWHWPPGFEQWIKNWASWFAFDLNIALPDIPTLVGPAVQGVVAIIVIFAFFYIVASDAASYEERTVNLVVTQVRRGRNHDEDSTTGDGTIKGVEERGLKQREKVRKEILDIQEAMERVDKEVQEAKDACRKAFDDERAAKRAAMEREVTALHDHAAVPEPPPTGADGTVTALLDAAADPSYEPTADEVNEYAKWVGIDLDTESDLLWIAREGLRTPLPKEWVILPTDAGEVYYYNSTTKESVYSHPIDAHYKAKVIEVRANRGKDLESRQKPDDENGEPYYSTTNAAGGGGGGNHETQELPLHDHADGIHAVPEPAPTTAIGRAASADDDPQARKGSVEDQQQQQQQQKDQDAAAIRNMGEDEYVEPTLENPAYRNDDERRLLTSLSGLADLRAQLSKLEALDEQLAEQANATFEAAPLPKPVLSEWEPMPFAYKCSVGFLRTVTFSDPDEVAIIDDEIEKLTKRLDTTRSDRVESGKARKVRGEDQQWYALRITLVADWTTRTTQAFIAVGQYESTTKEPHRIKRPKLLAAHEASPTTPDTGKPADSVSVTVAVKPVEKKTVALPVVLIDQAELEKEVSVAPEASQAPTKKPMKVTIAPEAAPVADPLEEEKSFGNVPSMSRSVFESNTNVKPKPFWPPGVTELIKETELILEKVNRLVCPKHQMRLITNVESVHSLVFIDGVSPYQCALQHKWWSRRLGATKKVTACAGCVDSYHVCPDDTCAYAVCNECLQINPIARIRSLVGTRLYVMKRDGAYTLLGLIIVFLSQLAYLPIVKTAIMLVSCHPSFQCEFPDCYGKLSASLLVSVLFSVVILIILGGGLPISLLMRVYQAKVVLRSNPVIGPAIEHRGLTILDGMDDDLWRLILKRDTSMLRSVYEHYEYRFAGTYALTFVFQAAMVVPIVFLQPNTLSQLVAAGVVEAAQLAYYGATAPFLNVWIDLLVRCGSLHQVLQLALMCFHRVAISKNPTDVTFSTLMLIVTLSYIFIVVTVLMIVAIIPIINVYLEQAKERERKALEALQEAQKQQQAEEQEAEILEVTAATAELQGRGDLRLETYDFPTLANWKTRHDVACFRKLEVPQSGAYRLRCDYIADTEVIGLLYIATRQFRITFPASELANTFMSITLGPEQSVTLPAGTIDIALRPHDDSSLPFLRFRSMAFLFSFWLDIADATIAGDKKFTQDDDAYYSNWHWVDEIVTFPESQLDIEGVAIFDIEMWCHQTTDTNVGQVGGTFRLEIKGADGDGGVEMTIPAYRPLWEASDGEMDVKKFSFPVMKLPKGRFTLVLKPLGLPDGVDSFPLVAGILATQRYEV